MAKQKALEDINASPDLLKGYNLTYEYSKHSQCDDNTTESLRKDIINITDYKLVIIGGACPNVTEIIAQYLRDFVQIEYLATSSDLADRKRYPSVYRLAAPERVGSAVVELLKAFNWSRIGFIQQAEGNLSMTINDLKKTLEVAKVAVIAPISTSTDSNLLLENMKALKHLHARIIVVTAFQETTLQIICNAYRLAIYGIQFVWIFTGTYSNKFWKNSGVSCTDTEMQTVVEGAFFCHTVKHYPFEDIRKANNTYSGFFRLIKDIRTLANMSKSEPFHYAVEKCYDHVWVAAYVLNCYLDVREETNRIVGTSGRMRYGRRKNRFLYILWPIKIKPRLSMADCIDKVDFEGTSGRIRFHKGAVNPVVELQRIQDARIKVVAYFMPDHSRYEWKNITPIWKDNSTPYDSPRTKFKEKPIPLSLSATTCGLAGVRISVTFACFLFNVVWRKHRIVKMSSPNINNIVLVGCVLLYISIVIKTTATTTKAMCSVQLFCSWIGFTTTFGSMLTKTWRVYRIFTNKQMKQNMSLRDKHLMVIIGILVSMETLVLIVWQSYSPHHVEEQQLLTETVTTDSGDKIVAFYRACVSDHSDYFNWTLQIVNGGLIAFGAFVAWETRRVHIDALNDSKTIGICLYNVVVLSVVGLFLSLMLKDKPIVLLGVTSVCLFAGTLVSEMLIFLPKMLAVYRKPIATPPKALINLDSSTTLKLTSNHIELSTIRAFDRATQTEFTTDWN